MKDNTVKQHAISPAGRALSSELDRDGLVHHMTLKESGRLAIVTELVRAELAIELEDGHVASASWIDSSLGKLGDILPCGHKAAAEHLGLSNGQARAFLAYLVRKGTLSRFRGLFSLPPAGEQ